MHKPMRRTLLMGAAAMTFAAGLTTAASAQDFPSKRIDMIVGYNAGGFTDSASRVVAEQMSKELGQTVVVENRGGASSTIAALAVSKADADGYTILASTASLAVNEKLYKSLEYSLLDDLVPVAVVLRAPEAFMVPKDGPDSLEAFLDKAKANRLTYAIPGNGTTSGFTYFSFFKDVVNVEIDAVPFSGGGPATQAAVGGQTDGYAASASGGVVGQINSGNLKCMAIAAPERDARLPDCPTLEELGHGPHYGFSWVAFWVPKGTPDDVIAKLNSAINAVAAIPEEAAKLEAGGQVLTMTPAEADEWVRNEVKVWGERVEAAGVAGSI